MEQEDVIVSIKDATFAYEKHLVFSDISFDVQKGEVLCLMGKNGCGKSTLIDSILGIHTLMNGEIIVDGQQLSEYKTRELAKKMAYVPQAHDRSFPYKTREIVLMGRTAYVGGFGSPDDEDKAIAEQIMEQVGIAHLADRPYTQISGGEMQMVMLARALTQKTPFILMDEPTAHLDISNEMLFLEIVADFIGKEKKTVLMATHSPNQAFFLEMLGLNVRVALMHEGSLIAVGRPEKVLTEENISVVYQVEGKIICDGGYRQLMPLRARREKR